MLYVAASNADFACLFVCTIHCDANRSTTMIIGYARVSTADQTLDMQTEALRKAGCEQIYSDVVARTGPRRDKTGAPELQHALQALRPNDTLVVWKLDRLTATMTELVRIIHELDKRNVTFVSLTEQFDTRTPNGKMMALLVGVFAGYEKELISQRTTEALRLARSRGRCGGRKPKLSEKQANMLGKLMSDRNANVADISKQFGIGRKSAYAYFNRWKGDNQAKAGGAIVSPIRSTESGTFPTTFGSV